MDGRVPHSVRLGGEVNPTNNLVLREAKTARALSLVRADVDVIVHDLKKPLKVVIDTGNGTAGAFAPQAFRMAGLEVIEQFTDLDPDFPNHEPDPARKDTVESP